MTLKVIYPLRSINMTKYRGLCPKGICLKTECQKGRCLKTVCLKGNMPFDCMPQRDYALWQYALEGLCLMTVCLEGRCLLTGCQNTGEPKWSLIFGLYFWQVCNVWIQIYIFELKTLSQTGKCWWLIFPFNTFTM